MNYIKSYLRGLPSGCTRRSTSPSFLAFTGRTFFPVKAISSASGRPIYRDRDRWMDGWIHVDR